VINRRKRRFRRSGDGECAIVNVHKCHSERSRGISLFSPVRAQFTSRDVSTSLDMTAVVTAFRNHRVDANVCWTLQRCFCG
jgi:hypothetical protein